MKFHDSSSPGGKCSTSRERPGQVYLWLSWSLSTLRDVRVRTGHLALVLAARQRKPFRGLHKAQARLLVDLVFGEQLD
jgi:hypothetical protein